MASIKYKIPYEEDQDEMFNVHDFYVAKKYDTFINFLVDNTKIHTEYILNI
jgi:hypothetical protein